MNEGIAKALRRDARAKGLGIRRTDGAIAVPGKETKALWNSLSHKERGQWRRQLAPTRAAQKRLCRVRTASFAGLRQVRVPGVVDFKRGSVRYVDGVVGTR